MAVRRSSLAALSLAALTFMGCANETTAPSPVEKRAAIQKPLATLDWNHIARSMIEKHKPNQQAAQRGMAYLTLAQYVAASEAGNVPPTPFTTPGAIAGASQVVLSYLYPADSAAFRADFDQILAREVRAARDERVRFFLTALRDAARIKDERDEIFKTNAQIEATTPQLPIQ